MMKKPITKQRLYSWTAKHLEALVPWLEIAKTPGARAFRIDLRMYSFDSTWQEWLYNPASPDNIKKAINTVRAARALLFTSRSYREIVDGFLPQLSVVHQPFDAPIFINSAPFDDEPFFYSPEFDDAPELEVQNV